jgi:ATP-dependent DNA helicase RecG
MSIESVNRLLNKTEDIRLEFKEAKNSLPANLFESICAMLNRDGGDILLGVNDSATIIGIEEEHLEKLITNIVNLSNNPQKIDPPFILFPKKYKIQHKNILHIQIPASSQVHKTTNEVFDRSNDGDFKVTNPAQIADLYNRKRNHFTENTMYPYLKFSDFKAELFPKIHNLIRSNNPTHPWLALTYEQMLEKAGLWRFDYQTGKSAYTLAAALLLGKDEVIQQILPHYKIDAIVRIKDKFRYDDRLYIQTNLIEAFEQLMGFVEKHLPDKFHQLGEQRISLRAHIFREIVANIIVHREYTNAYPCTFVINNGKVETENANISNGNGNIEIDHFVPFPKNPTIAKFFIQLGRVDELGSGVLNTHKFVKEYVEEGKPLFIEGNTFKVIIPIPDDEDENLIFEGVNNENEGVNLENEGVNLENGGVNLENEGVNLENVGANSKLVQILKIIQVNEGKRIPEYSQLAKINIKSLERYFKILRDQGLIEFRGEAPKTGGYYLIKKD